MKRHGQFFARVVAACLLSSAAIAQAPPEYRAPVAPKVEALNPMRCAPHDTRSTVGKGASSEGQDGAGSNFSDTLAQSGGVICPPPQADPEIALPTPPAGRTPVIPPSGAPGVDGSTPPK